MNCRGCLATTGKSTPATTTSVFSALPLCARCSKAEGKTVGGPRNEGSYAVAKRLVERARVAVKIGGYNVENVEDFAVEALVGRGWSRSVAEAAVVQFTTSEERVYRCDICGDCDNGDIVDGLCPTCGKV
jgi:Zn finger protein HypA/HybF involved in hydrogenase expression